MAFKTNLFNAAIRPVNLCTSFTILGEVMSSIAFTFFGFASIPHWETMKPRNFPDETPKTHLAWLSFILYLLKVPNVSWRLSRWVFALQACHPHRPPYSYLFACWTFGLLVSSTWHLCSSIQMAWFCNSTGPGWSQMQFSLRLPYSWGSSYNLKKHPWRLLIRGQLLNQRASQS